MNAHDPFDNLPPAPPPEAYAEEAEAPPIITPTPFNLRPASEIPPRQWLFGRHLIRGFLSLTVAPGGLGKSSLLIVEALAMATGRDLLGDAPPMPLRVWYWNGEDPREEVERRIAAASLHYGIVADAIGDRMKMDSGRDVPITLARMNGQGVHIAKPVSEALIAAIREAQTDVMIVDPFVTTHEVGENDNAALNAIVAEWRRIADATGCAIELVHHVSKAGAMSGDEIGIYASRGAGALIDGVRSARYLTRMRQEEAERFGIEEAEAAQHFRANMGKANLAPPEKATWRRMESVALGNGAGLWPEGDKVGVCVAWTPPDAFDGMTAHDLMRVQQAIEASEEAHKANERAADWIGYLVADTLGMDVGRDLKKNERSAGQNASRAKLRRILSEWIRNGALELHNEHDARTGREVKLVTVGEPVTPDDLA